MIDTKTYHVEERLNQALKQVNETNSVHLFSMTEQIDEIHMLHVFTHAKQMDEKRSYWSSTDDDFTIVGIGSAYELQASDRHYDALQAEWMELLDRSFIHNPYHVSGTGIVALGGMTFDPKKKPTSLWNTFGVNLLHVPTYSIVQDRDDFYLTVTCVLDQETKQGDVLTLFDEAEDCLRTLNEKSEIERQSPVVQKNEIGTEKWLENVTKAIQYIRDDRAKKIVLAREMRVQLRDTVQIGSMLEKLHALQTNCFIYAFARGEDCFIGATPERLVRIEGEDMLSTCLAGTAPRGKTKEEDERIGLDLLQDNKNLEEHAYVVQMITNAITPYCTDVKLAKKPVLRPLKNLQHLYTPVTAKVKSEFHIFDLIKSLHPTPALGGVPSDVALAFMREHEELDRGWYGAPIGWLDSNQHGEFAVGIRSALVQGDEVSLFAGCGIMRDSDPEEEYEETNIKFLPILSVLEDEDDTY